MEIQQFNFQKEGLRQIEEIFFLSTNRKTFADEADRNQFYKKWTDFYFQNEPANVWVAIDHGKDQGKVVGYLMGCPDSSKALAYYKERLQSYALFSDLFQRFPAHLHINCHPDVRGRGVGSRLIEAFAGQLRASGVKGLHLVTEKTSRNRIFYQRNGFLFEEEREQNKRPFLFMGRVIN